MIIIVERVAPRNGAFNAADGKVHLAELPCCVVGFLTINRDILYPALMGKDEFLAFKLQVDDLLVDEGHCVKLVIREDEEHDDSVRAAGKKLLGTERDLEDIWCCYAADLGPGDLFAEIGPLALED